MWLFGGAADWECGERRRGGREQKKAHGCRAEVAMGLAAMFWEGVGTVEG